MKTAMDIPDKEGQKRLVIVGGGFGENRSCFRRFDNTSYNDEGLAPCV